MTNSASQSNLRVFVSSTYLDLQEHRAALEFMLTHSHIDYNVMEHFGANPQPPLQTCLEAVEQSNFFVGLIGVRYGSAPLNRKRSFTEREYLHARQLGLPIHMFLIDENEAQVRPADLHSESADQQQRLKNFRDAVSRAHTVDYFTTPHLLTNLVLASIIRYMQ